MTDKELLAVLDMSEPSQKIWLVGMDILRHTRGPNGQVALLESLADLAFRLNAGSIAGKQPMEWIINALISRGQHK